eukprot:scpid63811/ scgid35027/ 
MNDSDSGCSSVDCLQCSFRVEVVECPVFSTFFLQFSIMSRSTSPSPTSSSGTAQSPSSTPVGPNCCESRRKHVRFSVTDDITTQQLPITCLNGSTHGFVCFDDWKSELSNRLTVSVTVCYWSLICETET